MEYINYQVVILLVYIVIGSAMINQIKNINGFYKLSIFMVLLNLILTILTPNMSLFNLIAYDEIKFNITDKDYWSIRGQMGDLLAGHFTALAFIGLMLTINQMSKALEQQNDAISIQKQEMDKQFKEMNKQSFENKFFQMLSLFNNNIQTLQVNIDGTDYNKKDIFKPLKETFELMMQNDYLSDVSNSCVKKNKFVYFEEQFISFNDFYDTTVKYYFLNLFQILNYIDTDIPNKENAKKYTNILRAQLSKNELLLLAYNAIGVQHFTTNDYQKLVEKYEFFEHLSFDDFHENTSILEMVDSVLYKYHEDAFGDNTDILEKINKTR